MYLRHPVTPTKTHITHTAVAHSTVKETAAKSINQLAAL